MRKITNEVIHSFKEYLIEDGVAVRSGGNKDIGIGVQKRALRKICSCKRQ